MAYGSSMNTAKPTHSVQRAQRRDGLATRSVILETAGPIFAERGFSDATSKEICERANVNSAAVNYYFGGKENLYAEVLREAHRQLLSLEDLDEIITSGAPPETKLREFLAKLLQTATASGGLWGIKVFLRELAAPSSHAERAMTTVILPKSLRLRQLLHNITGLPEDSAVMQRATAFVVLPCISLILFPDALRTTVLPATATDSEGMLDDLVRYVMGGLRGLAGSG